MSRSRSNFQHAPYIQGDLDGLCGIYSLVNAVQLLMPEFTEDDATDMFNQILKFIERKKRLSRVIEEGLTDKELNRIIRSFIHKGYNIKGDLPFSKDKKKLPLDIFIQKIVAFLAEGAIIISICSKHWEHWSVVKRVTQKEIHFFDSSQLCKLRLKRCTTGKATKDKPHILVPGETFFLSKTS